MNHRDAIAGIDACKSGWIIATDADAVVVPTLRLDAFTCVGIDMPIGLSDGPPRQCDIAARRYLASARSSVFPAPPRAALACTTYEAALATARSTTGRGMSLQTYHIMPKVAEVDRLVGPEHHDVVIEVHPECAFKTLNDGETLPSKTSVDGRAIRRRLLSGHFDVPSRPPRGAAVDDLLDAYAVLWSAHRFRRGEHRQFGDGSRDDRGIEMRIVC